ncbi:hypothetical protein ACHAW5_006004 [Stephanodiscus triporus]|uniref:Peptidase A1 domain-containing protein n=1 Tax=Stephanodiscus triporus TaxID=2934178 RepID=A0ABD3MVH2_9STRA
MLFRSLAVASALSLASLAAHASRGRRTETAATSSDEANEAINHEMHALRLAMDVVVWEEGGMRGQISLPSTSSSSAGRSSSSSLQASLAEQVRPPPPCRRRGQYYGTIKIGSPPQKFTVMMEHRLVEPLGAKVNLQNCGYWFINGGKSKYDEAKSSSFKKGRIRLSHQYGSGDVPRLFLRPDHVTLAEDIIVKDQNAIDQDAVSRSMFAFYLGDEMDGELTLGGYDDARYAGEITWVSLSEPKYWQIDIGNVQVGSFSSALPTASSTRERPDHGPSADIMKIAARRGRHHRTCSDSTPWTARGCRSIPDLAFSVDGKAFVVPGKDLVIQSGGTCLFAMMGMDIPSGPQWMVGFATPK